MNNPPARSPHLANLLVALLVVLAILSGAFYVLRFGGQMMEVDASRQTISASGIITTGQLQFPRAYNNGYGYGAQLAFTSLLTGIDLNAVQLGSGVWIFVVALAGFIAYRELLGGASAAALATFILLVQPDFLFYMVRGSHERTSWTCALLMVFFLMRSYRFANSPSRLAANVLLFYLAFWGMTTGNVYFASTFIVAIALCVALGWGLDHTLFRRSQAAQPAGHWWRRLLLVSFTCLIIVYIFIIYIYGPARQSFFIFQELVDRIALLILGLQPLEATESYNYLSVAWKDPAAYLGVTGVQWVISISSVGIWLWLMFRLNRLDSNRRLLWQLYTSFGILLAVGLVADFAKFLNSNLELRMFTPFALFSSPLVAFGLLATWRRLRLANRRWVAPAAGLLAVFAFLAVQAKITNEPLISNQWQFYSPAEVRAGEWMGEHVSGQLVWIDTRDHLRQVYYFLEGYTVRQPNAYIFRPDQPDYTYVLISQLTQLRADRIGISLPATFDALKIYDNGAAWLYHRRPQTPYQP